MFFYVLKVNETGTVYDEVENQNVQYLSFNGITDWSLKANMCIQNYGVNISCSDKIRLYKIL